MQVLLLAACLVMCACAEGQRAGNLPDQGDHPDLSALLDPGDMASPGGDGGGCTPKVNEVQTGGAGGGTDEFVELYNPCPDQFLLTGYKIAYRAAATAGATDSGTIATLTGYLTPNAYYLVANGGFTGTADIKPFNGTITGLAATGGAVGLRDPNGVLLDSVGWGTAVNPFVETQAAPAPATSRSIARHPDGRDTDNNSTDFIDSTPTPKASN
jgi:hypothetical protein